MDGGMVNAWTYGRTDGWLVTGAVILCSFPSSLLRTVSSCDPGTGQVSKCLLNE